ncbi:RmlC-like cupin domain-containing protein [Aspergillus alliaceus]|uniref:RmlC-like cupin domain-containing protein n=1 Tax=Petromyces alliaceus TaxID=209559 RepID=UPI0012A75468|nr:RmlC-like cupin domain-containing protein [Aspergillus alliaceus]KAB8235653.1 RmlC-like cupin domain-containing protein [Aspergillus alliaceus]
MKAFNLQNPDSLGHLSTGNGFVPNLKWSSSDSKTRLFLAGWVRGQVIQDLLQSHDISGAQQHLKKRAIWELYWHRVVRTPYSPHSSGMGFLYAGSLLLSGVDENGQSTTEKLETDDIWYFPKGVAHNVQGLDDENEYLLVFDDGGFEKVGTTFMVDDWITHTRLDILAKILGVDPSVFDKVPENSYVYHTYKHPSEPVPGSGGTFRKIDSRNIPVSQTIAAALVELEPKGLRELHWLPNAEEWLYLHQGNARATVFLGDSEARTFGFTAGDTAVEIYKSDRVADISLAQWLALTPADVVATTLKVDI